MRVNKIIIQTRLNHPIIVLYNINLIVNTGLIKIKKISRCFYDEIIQCLRLNKFDCITLKVQKQSNKKFKL